MCCIGLRNRQQTAAARVNGLTQRAKNSFDFTRTLMDPDAQALRARVEAERQRRADEAAAEERLRLEAEEALRRKHALRRTRGQRPLSRAGGEPNQPCYGAIARKRAGELLEEADDAHMSLMPNKAIQLEARSVETRQTAVETYWNVVLIAQESGDEALEAKALHELAMLRIRMAGWAVRVDGGRADVDEPSGTAQTSWDRLGGVEVRAWGRRREDGGADDGRARGAGGRLQMLPGSGQRGGGGSIVAHPWRRAHALGDIYGARLRRWSAPWLFTRQMQGQGAGGSKWHGSHAQRAYDHVARGRYGAVRCRYGIERGEDEEEQGDSGDDDEDDDGLSGDDEVGQGKVGVNKRIEGTPAADGAAATSRTVPLGIPCTLC